MKSVHLYLFGQVKITTYCQIKILPNDKYSLTLYFPKIVMTCLRFQSSSNFIVSLWELYGRISFKKYSLPSENRKNQCLIWSRSFARSIRICILWTIEYPYSETTVKQKLSKCIPSKRSSVSWCSSVKRIDQNCA